MPYDLGPGDAGPDDPGPDDIEAFRRDLADIEHRVQREFGTGGRTGRILLAVTALVVAMLMPLTSSARAWTILSGSLGDDELGSIFLRVFIVLAVAGGIAGSLLALVTRRWALAWATMFSQGLGVLFGMFALWAEATAHPHARTPAIALYAAFALTVVLAYQWIRVVTNKENILPPVTRYPEQDL
ncbi:hypothetical protein HT102_15490 [Hoyosella sp. G463]|uniref:Uncharacterized protein n=1 Tax=Lolliginicoccus lacisalsi TaxID=2742202 RepID=A0A927PNB2_9ACTN|nr:hypothetical protein [Lolliginicoccus lacisalsi]MBD8507892.1 hypothetical protein [Lolliginicoccus lacisalsi]